MVSHLTTLAILLGIVPFLAVPALFLTFYLRRATARSNRRRGRRPSRLYPSTFVLGLALQHLQAIFTRPSIEHVLEQKYDENADEDEQGDPDHPKAQLRRQLKRIRNGEDIDRLILRL
jgi:hypothetical protein